MTMALRRPHKRMKIAATFGRSDDAGGDARAPSVGRANDSSPAGEDAGRFRVLLVSALPPPVGGLATWTQVLLKRGLPKPFEVELVDTRVARRHQSMPTSLGLAEIRRTLRILTGVHRALRSGRFSIMHMNCSLYFAGAFRNLASALIARRAKVPYVAHLHGLFRVPAGNGPLAILYRWACRTIFDGAASVLALGLPSYRAVLELGDFREKTQLMPNYVDLQAVPTPTPKTERPDLMRVVFTGSLVESKGVFTIVEVAKRFPRTQFRLIGDASDESKRKLSEYIREQGVGDRVQLLGPLSNNEVLAMLQENDVFLFPSMREGFPISVAEAMAVGLPVVASPVGAIPEMIDVPEGGYLVAPDDPAGYVEALSRLDDDPSLMERMGRHNRRKAEREYDYDVVIRRLCDIYSRIGCRSFERPESGVRV